MIIWVVFFSCARQVGALAHRHLSEPSQPTSKSKFLVRSLGPRPCPQAWHLCSPSSPDDRPSSTAAQGAGRTSHLPARFRFTSGLTPGRSLSCVTFAGELLPPKATWRWVHASQCSQKRKNGKKKKQTCSHYSISEVGILVVVSACMKSFKSGNTDDVCLVLSCSVDKSFTDLPVLSDLMTTLYVGCVSLAC